MKKALCICLVAAGSAVGTWLLGWWAVPIVALVAGLMRCGTGIVALASAAGWLVLLLLDALTGNISAVASMLGGIMGLPAQAMFALTLALPALLGGSAASLGRAV